MLFPYFPLFLFSTWHLAPRLSLRRYGCPHMNHASASDTRARARATPNDSGSRLDDDDDNESERERPIRPPLAPSRSAPSLITTRPTPPRKTAPVRAALEARTSRQTAQIAPRAPATTTMTARASMSVSEEPTSGHNRSALGCRRAEPSNQTAAPRRRRCHGYVHAALDRTERARRKGGRHAASRWGLPHSPRVAASRAATTRQRRVAARAQTRGRLTMT